MRRPTPVAFVALIVTLGAGISLALAPGLPDALDGYWTWTRLNVDRVLENPSGAHPQPKDVYISLSDAELLDGDALSLPFPDGTVVVKERGDPDTLQADRIYLMEKIDGRWLYSFYDRQADDSFSGQELGADNFCSGCHAGASDTDFVFTEYQRR